ncbi:hypothetical protein E4U50_008427 [Claviceps purpurea]|nr:hypothetical protein E4U37_006960 [Claviceps purpurea]KAG6214690.1 hypothetical protein E4U50_008427 [Claviceps purpurea]
MPARPRTGIPSLRKASRVEPGASLPAPTPKTPPSSQQRHRHRHSTPILVLVFHVQRLLVCLSSLWCLNSPLVASTSLVRYLHSRTHLAANLGACGASNGLSMSAQATAGRWEGRSTQALRKKLFYEIAVFVLGCGNPVIVLLLWPGWLIVGGLAFVLWRYFV